MVIITLYNSKLLLSLHYFLTPQFQTFTNLLIGICGVSNSTFFWDFWETVSIIVNIISNNTVLQCYLPWIFFSIRRLLQIIVCIGVSVPPHLKNTTPSFANSHLKSANYPSPPPPFLGDSRHPPNFFFHAVKSHIKTFYH